MANNTFLPTGFTVTSTFATLASYLDAAGIDTDQSPVTSQDGYIKNNDTAIDLYIGQGTTAPSAWATVGPESAILFETGLNTSLVWIKAASSTITVDFVEGANSYNPPLVNGVIGTLTATENVVPKADSSGNLVASTISDDGAGTVTIASDTSVTGTVTSDDATTPAFIVASGNTNTGYIDVFGKTSGKIRITTADATAQTINITAAAQTSGASTITIPDLAGASTGLATTTVAQTLTNKTLTAPVLNAGTVGTSLVPTTDDGAPLGDTTHNFSDLFLASGAVINFANGNEVLTHSSGILTVTTGDLRVTTAGTNTASVVTVGGTQTLAAKTLTTPVIGVATGTSLAVTGLLTTSSPTAAFGFATGAGGAQTQATNKQTTVVSNTNTTAITMNNENLAAATITSFTFTNSAIAATDQVIVTHQSGGTSGAYTLNAFPGAGSAVISVRNNTAGGLAEAIVLRVSILKAVSA